LGRREYNIFIPGSEIERYSESALKLTRREVLIDWLVALNLLTENRLLAGLVAGSGETLNNIPKIY
jgi:hypothetical protein